MALPLLCLVPLLGDAREDLLARERALAARVVDERAAADVRALVAFGPRMGGTESGDAASAWLAEELRASGLTAEVRTDPEAWCHEERSWSVSVRPSGATEARVLESAWPWGFSPSARGSARLALAPTEGGAWLVEHVRERRTSPPAPAVLLVDGETTSDGAYPRLRELQPPGDDHPFPVFGLARADGVRLRSWLDAGRTVEVDFALDARVRRGAPRTVLARLPAREGAAAGFVLYCAHGDSDSGGPGANDNASGEAVVLAIARAWSAAVREGALPPPPLEVRFAVWGSEIRSTRAFLAACGDDPPLAVLNFDQAGFGSGGERVHLEPDDLPANRSLLEALLGVLEDHSGTSGFPARWATNRSLGGTDSYVFSDTGRARDGGRPALTVFTSAWGEPDEHPRTAGMPGESWNDGDVVHMDYDVHYHSAGDTPANTTDREPWNMGWCARVAWLGGLRWLEARAQEAEPR